MALKRFTLRSDGGNKTCGFLQNNNYYVFAIFWD